MTRPILLYVLTALVVISCLADIGTFLGFISNSNTTFEVNPIFIFLKSYVSIFWDTVIVILYKILVNISLIYLLWSYKPGKEHVFAYFLTFSVITAIFIQGFGAYKNVTVHNLIQTSPTGSITPLTISQVHGLFEVVSIVYGLLILINLGIFIIYEQLYREEYRKPSFS